MTPIFSSQSLPSSDFVSDVPMKAVASNVSHIVTILLISQMVSIHKNVKSTRLMIHIVDDSLPCMDSRVDIPHSCLYRFFQEICLPSK